MAEAWIERAASRRQPGRGARPRVEAVEGRRLLSGGVEPVLIGAMTPDSQAVVVHYRMDKPSGGDLAFGVFRSADAVYGASDTPVGGLIVRTNGENGPTLDLAGQPATAAGEHAVVISSQGGLPPNPSQPYVLAVADPAGGGDLASRTASIRTHVLGVVTHGGMQPESWAKGVPWQINMANSLRGEGYDAVIAYNWAAESRKAGSAVKQGPKLERMILDAAAQFPAGDPVDLHLIGHSEGAVVNSQALIRLQKDGLPPQLQSGYIKVTMLDPHAATNGFQGQQYSVESGLVGWIARQRINSFQSRANDPPVIVPPGVDDAEVFYQHTPVGLTHGANGGVYNLWGQVPVVGQATYTNLTGLGVSHAGDFGVQVWYQENVVPTLGEGRPSPQPDKITATVDIPTATALAAALPTAEGNEPVFRGTASPGSKVSLVAVGVGVDGSANLGRTTAGPDGTWALTSRPLPSGRYRLFTRARVPLSAEHPRVFLNAKSELGEFAVGGRARRGGGST